MSPTAPSPQPYLVKVHTYLSSASSRKTSPMQTYEHLPNFPAAASENALVFIGGLGDGPHTIPYVRTLAERLFSSSSPSPSPSSSSSSAAAVAGPYYAVFEARLTSAFTAFGYGSLAQDAREIGDLVRYLRRDLGMRKVVLMGHSTGCQDCLEYGTKFVFESSSASDDDDDAEVVRVDGFVLQGPVSDREAIAMGEDAAEVAAALRVAEEMVKEGKAGEVMPQNAMPKGWKGSLVTAYRWLSLAGVGGDDDYFSSDLSDEKLTSIWGKLEQPVLILPSEKDEWVPPQIDVVGLVNRWKRFCKPGVASECSGLIPGANHRVENADGQHWLAERVARFLITIDSQRIEEL
ncbi:uncharacterized protein B0T15DRAFT_542245 [Chaetomium strumarium]|uniref:DUF1749-domain-containing protein n=1 Tax=Chaetomium strumarium TaxID=1170767 RepID=A0AAJ0GLL6_9PEZI|nr:hypothetical protein B0T15DRAFT_542245 [Chaetomium strumarium]